jgi:hypothetical protein
MLSLTPACCFDATTARSHPESTISNTGTTQTNLNFCRLFSLNPVAGKSEEHGKEVGDRGTYMMPPAAVLFAILKTMNGVNQRLIWCRSMTSLQSRGDLHVYTHTYIRIKDILPRSASSLTNLRVRRCWDTNNDEIRKQKHNLKCVYRRGPTKKKSELWWMVGHLDEVNSASDCSDRRSCCIDLASSAASASQGRVCFEFSPEHRMYETRFQHHLLPLQQRRKRWQQIQLQAQELQRAANTSFGTDRSALWETLHWTCTRASVFNARVQCRGTRPWKLGTTRLVSNLRRG